MDRSAWTRSLASALATLALAGCAALESELERRRPSAEIADVRLAGLDFDGARLEADVRIDNPNPVAIGLDGLDYALAVEGQRVLSGKREQGLSVPGEGRRTLAVPIDLAFAELARLPGDLAARDSVAYAVELGLALDSPVLGRERLPLRAEGRLPVARAPAIRLADLRVEEFGWRGARLVLDLGVDNPNAFGVELDALRYELHVDGERWASTGAESGTAVPANGRATVSLPFRLDFGAVGREAYRLLTGGGPLDYALEGTARGRAGERALGRFEHAFSRTGRLRLNGE